jgi:hypothetical protein
MNRSRFVLAFCAPCVWALAACGSSSSGTPGSTPPSGTEAMDGAVTDATGDALGTSVTDGSATTTDGSTGSGTEAGSSDAGGGDGASSDGAIVCNTLANTAAAVTTQVVASPPPMLAGGTLTDGTYTLTALTQFTGDAGMSGTGGMSSTTIEISGTTIQVSNNGSTSTETVVTSGTSFTDTRTCPTAAMRSGTYAATSTMFIVLFEDGTADGGTNFVQETFTIQP